MKQLAEVRTLRVNRYMIIDDEPCKIMSISTSKPGKHGEAKARIEAIGVFDGQKRSVVHPVKHKIHVPIIDKRNAQILAIMGENVQLMDLETYETFEAAIPSEDDLKNNMQEGVEIEYWNVLGRTKIMRTKGSG